MDNDNLKDNNRSVTASVPLKPLSSEHEKLYDNIENQKWYKDLNPVKRALVKQYKGKITDGKHALSTQLRELVGIKNGYAEHQYIINPLQNTKFNNEDCSSMVRSATLAHNIGYGDYAIDYTVQNLKHIRDITGKNLAVECLNHDLAIRPGSDLKIEHKIVQTLSEATKKLGNKASFSNNRISFSLNNTQNIKNVAQEYERTNKTKNTILCISCKSGKDRTGLTAAEGEMVYLENKGLADSEDIDKIAAVQHQSFLSATNSQGAFGLKTNTPFITMKSILRKNSAKVTKYNFSPKIANLNGIKLDPKVIEETKQSTEIFQKIFEKTNQKRAKSAIKPLSIQKQKKLQKSLNESLIKFIREDPINNEKRVINAISTHLQKEKKESGKSFNKLLANYKRKNYLKAVVITYEKEYQLKQQSISKNKDVTQSYKKVVEELQKMQSPNHSPKTESSPTAPSISTKSTKGIKKTKKTWREKLKAIANKVNEALLGKSTKSTRPKIKKNRYTEIN